jgi:predicted GNAT family N-acyltransferase
MSLIETSEHLSFIRLSSNDTDLYAQVLSLRNIFRVKRGFSYHSMVESDDSKGTDIYLLTRNGIPTATARSVKTPEGYRIGMVATDLGSQGRGYATLIMKRLILICLELLQPGEIIYLSAVLDKINMYERLGFKAVGDVFIMKEGNKFQKMIYIGTEIERL